jgi:hypothetical protein
MTNSAAPGGVSSNCRGGDARYDSAAEPVSSPTKALLTHCVSRPSGKVQRREGVFMDVPTALIRRRYVWKVLGVRSPFLI